MQIIVDSCCDMTEELREKIQPLVAPLTIYVSGREYVDDGSADIAALLRDMAASEKSVQTSCPSPAVYQEMMLHERESLVVTLSSKLSGSYNAACVARNMVLEEHPDKKIHVFDSLSAVVGETQIAMFLRERINEGLAFEEIVPLVERFIRQVRTFFVLEDLSNLLKNGRMLQVAGHIASMIRLCPVMGENGEGEIKLISPSLGIERALRKLTGVIAQHTEGAKEKSIQLYIGFCNCRQRAEALQARLLTKCAALSGAVLVPTGALSTTYANDGGIIIAL